MLLFQLVFRQWVDFGYAEMKKMDYSYFDDNSNPESIGHRCCSFCYKICICDSCAQNHSDESMPDKDSAMTSTLNRTIQTKLYSYMETINNEIEDVCGCDGQMISGLTPSLMDDISSHPNVTASTLKELYGYLADQYLWKLQTSCHALTWNSMSITVLITLF